MKGSGLIKKWGVIFHVAIKIQNLTVKIDALDKTVLEGFGLEIGLGQTHVIMGQNGSGKSTLGNILAAGLGWWCNRDRLSLMVKIYWRWMHMKALQGLFMSFQYPMAIPGLNNISFCVLLITNI